MDVHNGKQAFDITSARDNWAKLDDELNRAYSDYLETL